MNRMKIRLQIGLLLEVGFDVNVIDTRLEVAENEAFIGEISAMLRKLQPHCISRPKHQPVPVQAVTIPHSLSQSTVSLMPVMVATRHNPLLR